MSFDLESAMFKYEKESIALEDFCKANKSLYIYGAGKFGAKYYDLLKDKYKIKGFVVSDKKDGGVFLGLPVVAVCDFHDDSESVGVIPAFKGSDACEIKRKFSAGNVDVFVANTHDFISYYSRVKPLLNLRNMLKEYGEPAKLPLPSDSPSLNILIIRLDAIGDVICTTPFIREVRRNYPKAFITVVIRTQNKELLENCPYIDELLLYDTGYNEKDLFACDFDYAPLKEKVDAFIQREFKRKYDVVFQPMDMLGGRNKIQELLLAFASGAKWRVGRIMANSEFKNTINSVLSDCYTHIAMQTFAMHEIVYTLEMLRVCVLKAENYLPELWPSDSHYEKAKSLLESAKSKARFLVAVGLAGSEPKKAWPEEKYRDFFLKINARYGDEVVFALLGGNEIQEEACRLESACKNVLDCVGKCSLNETAALISMCNLYLGSNTGLLHMAAVGKIDAIVLYANCLSDEPYIGGGGPCRWEALGVVNFNLIPPAGLDGCHSMCSKDEPHCIKQIEVGQVEMAFNCMKNRF